MNLARTTLSSKILAQDREFFAEMAVKAIIRQGKVYFKNCLFKYFILFISF